MNHQIITKEFSTVVNLVVTFIQKKGFKIFDNIDQCQEATNVGLNIPKTRLIIFGNPKIGTLLMQENDDITFELPIKLLLIQKGNQTELIYRDPLNFAGHEKLTETGKKILQKMHKMYLEMYNFVSSK